MHRTRVMQSGAQVTYRRIPCPPGGTRELHVVVLPPPGGTFEEQLASVHKGYEQLLSELGVCRDSALLRRVFLSDAANQEAVVRESALAQGEVALSVVEQPPAFGRKVALLAEHAEAEGEERTQAGSCLLLRRNGLLHLWDMGGAPASGSDAAGQTWSLLSQAQKNLERSGGRMRDHTHRTWFFIADIDKEYAGLVEARRAFFLEEGLTEETHYIASTGIAGRGESAAQRVMMEAYSVVGLPPEAVKYLAAPEHLGPTQLYGVTFERGTRLRFADRDRCFISGTASIEPGGSTVHVGDVVAQTRRALLNVEALLKDGGLCASDLVSAVVYLRDAADEEAVSREVTRAWPEVPWVLVRAAVCRPSWLVEVECLAVRLRAEVSVGLLGVGAY